VLINEFSSSPISRKVIRAVLPLYFRFNARVPSTDLDRRVSFVQSESID
jgi:hypothetical protein